jgi:hypothetical protein
MRAADSLVSRLTSLSSVHPRATLAFIAHSHGGNVALMAAQDKTVGPRVAAVVALSTPFLRVSLRRGDYDLQMRLLAIALVLALGAIVWGVAWVIFKFVVDQQSTVAYVTFVIVVLLAYTTALGVSLALYVSKRTSLWGKAKAQGLSDRLRITPSDPKGLLVVRPVADEATLALALGQAWSWCVQSFERLALWLLAFSTCCLAGVYALMRLRLDRLQDAYVTIPLILVGSLLVSLVVAEYGRVLAYTAFGFRPNIATLHLDVSVEATPIGMYQILQAGPTQSEGLNHSATWQTWQVVDQAIVWLRERLDRFHAADV